MMNDGNIKDCGVYMTAKTTDVIMVRKRNMQFKNITKGTRMTDKLKCCFCGAELEKEMAGDIETGRLVCCTKNCPVIDQNLFPDVWELLTTGKRAQDALKGIEIRVAAIRSCVQDGYTQLGERNRNIFIALELFKDLIKEITSITTRNENEVS